MSNKNSDARRATQAVVTSAAVAAATGSTGAAVAPILGLLGSKTAGGWLDWRTKRQRRRIQAWLDELVAMSHASPELLNEALSATSDIDPMDALGETLDDLLDGSDEATVRPLARLYVDRVAHPGRPIHRRVGRMLRDFDRRLVAAAEAVFSELGRQIAEAVESGLSVETCEATIVLNAGESLNIGTRIYGAGGKVVHLGLLEGATAYSGEVFNAFRSSNIGQRLPTADRKGRLSFRPNIHNFVWRDFVSVFWILGGVRLSRVR